MAQEYTREQVAEKNTVEDGLWLIVDSKVYDLTDFADAHPGGEFVLKQVAGKDATTEFYNLHRQEVLEKYQSLCIGTIKGETERFPLPVPGQLGEIPYAEPQWLNSEFTNLNFKDSHRRLQKEMRVFCDTYVRPEAAKKEVDGTRISDELIQRMADTNILAMRLGPGKHLKGRTLLNGVVTPEEFDYFHELVVNQELARCPGRGFADGNLSGMTIGLPAALNFANSEELRQRMADEVLSGRKKICLAISEAFAGSDVAGMKTTAVKSADGRSYTINGTKKWITNGHWCDYFVTAARTERGYSMFLVERGAGLETAPIKTSYSPTAGTAFVTFDDVVVPASHLLGEEDKGFAIIMSNFNHERWVMCCGSIRGSRLVVEECMKWANQRVVFGKRLIEQPVIRQKLAKLLASVEATQAWLETITLQMTRMSYAQQARNLAGPIGLLKMYTTRVAHEVADESVQIFGGRALTQTGMGRNVEMFNRTYKFDSILGGSEEILADLAVKQALKKPWKSML